MMVRETVGTGAGTGALVVATVVVVTVCVVVYDGDAVWVCADTNAAAARKMKARDRFFTRVLDLGEIERFLVFLSMVADKCLNAKDRKGWVFGNCVLMDVREVCRALLAPRLCSRQAYEGGCPHVGCSYPSVLPRPFTGWRLFCLWRRQRVLRLRDTG